MTRSNAREIAIQLVYALGFGDVTAQELLEVHQRIYRRHLSPATYQRCVQLPLAPGQQPGPPVAWTEE